jgi:error-prone DNA polymerase
VEPDLFDDNRVALVETPYIRIDGVLQNQEGVVAVRARRVEALETSLMRVPSHDFH